MSSAVVEVIESFTYLGVDIHHSMSSEHDIRKPSHTVACYCMQLYGFPRSQYLALFHVSPHQAMTVKSPSFQSSSVEQNHRSPLNNSRAIWMHLTSGVCVVYYKFPVGPTFLMKRSADILTSHNSCTSSVPPALSSLVTLYMPVHSRTTVKPLGPV